MFRRILFPTDFSEYARRVMDCIAGLPGVQDIVLLHVIPSTSPSALKGDMVSSARERIELDRLALTRLGITNTRAEVLVSESIPRCIEETAERNECTMIVMGARGKGIIKGLHLGSVTLNVLHESKTDLLIMRGEIIEKLSGETFQKYCPMIFSRVLVPIDLSSESWDSVRKIAKIPDINEIILCYVLSRGESERELENTRKAASGKMEEECISLRDTGVDIRWRILEGDPVSRVSEYADEGNVSLICTMPEEKSAIREFFRGSFSCELARSASRPVLVIKS